MSMQRIRAARQRGFTLIELMVATFTGMILITVVFSIMYQTLSMGEQVFSELRFIHESREMRNILVNGGDNGTTDVPGFRGRDSLQNLMDTTSASMYRLNVDDILYSSDLQGVQISCRAGADPYSECVSTETEPVYGFLANEPNTTTPISDIGNDLSTIELTLVNPYNFNRKNSTDDDSITSYFLTLGLYKETP